jgi:hypothetical protein
MIAKAWLRLLLEMWVRGWLSSERLRRLRRPRR